MQKLNQKIYFSPYSLRDRRFGWSAAVRWYGFITYEKMVWSNSYFNTKEEAAINAKNTLNNIYPGFQIMNESI